MSNKLQKTVWLLGLALLPLAAGAGNARAGEQQSAPQASQPAAGSFTLGLADGSSMKGSISFVISLDTQYGVMKIPSSLMVAARFDAAHDWADIQLKDAELSLKYKPASSDIKASTSAGPLNIQLAKVTTIAQGNAQPPSVASPNTGVNPAYIPPPQAYAQQAPPVVVAPQAPAYQYAPEPYYYTSPYYYEPPAYYYPPDYYVAPEPYGWPGLGFGVVVGPGFGFRGGFGRGGFGGGGFRGGFGGGGFHGGFGGGHR